MPWIRFPIRKERKGKEEYALSSQLELFTKPITPNIGGEEEEGGNEV